MVSDKLIIVKNAYKSFGKTEVLKGVDMELESSQTLVILGDNGAGKSTLIKCLCGIEKFDAFDTFDVGKCKTCKKYSLKKARICGMEVVFQEAAIGDLQEIWRNIFAGRHIKTKLGFINRKKEITITNKILKEFLGFTGAGLNATSTAKNLSGGEKQGLAIARAIYFKSKILMLDEPTTSLGVNETSRLKSFIKKAKNEGISIVLITHNLNFAYEFGDKFILLRRGKIEKTALKDEITDINALYEMLS